MKQVTIYSTPICPYCDRAKHLLQRKGISFQEIDITTDPQLRDTMIQKAGGRTSVPQIFIEEDHIGGCDDLYALDRAGELDARLT